MLPSRRYNGQYGLTDFFNDFFDNKALDAIKKLKQGNTVNLMYIKAKGPDGKEIQLRGLPIELN